MIEDKYSFITRQEFLGHDDDGNLVYRIIRFNPNDPDDSESFLDYEYLF